MGFYLWESIFFYLNSCYRSIKFEMMNWNSIVQNTTEMCKNAYNFVFILWGMKMSMKYTKILVSTQATILFESIVWWSSSYDLLNKIKRSLTSFLLAQISTERHHNFIFKVKTNGRSKNKENYTKCFKQTLKKSNILFNALLICVKTFLLSIFFYIFVFGSAPFAFFLFCHTWT